MKSYRPFLLTILAIAAAALLAGCGGTSKADYEKDVKSIGKDVSKEMKAFEAGEPSASDLEDAAKSLDGAADDLDDITPPSEVKDLHEDLIKALRDGGESLGAMAPLLEKVAEDPSSLTEKDSEKMSELGTDVQKLGERMDKVTKGFEKKDYDLGFED